MMMAALSDFSNDHANLQHAIDRMAAVALTEDGVSHGHSHIHGHGHSHSHRKEPLAGPPLGLRDLLASLVEFASANSLCQAQHPFVAVPEVATMAKRTKKLRKPLPVGNTTAAAKAPKRCWSAQKELLTRHNRGSKSV